MKLLKTFTIIAGVLLLQACASYQASTLAVLPPDQVREYKEAEGLMIGCKEFSEDDCMRYLDRNLLEKGYQPVQLTFFNQSKESYFFSTDRINLPCASVKSIKDSMYTSTASRVTGYALGSLLVPFLTIPAVVDGIMSYNSNKEIDKDIDTKAKEEFMIMPGSFRKIVIFVPKDSYKKNFNISLLDNASNESRIINLKAIR